MNHRKPRENLPKKEIHKYIWQRDQRANNLFCNNGKINRRKLKEEHQLKLIINCLLSKSNTKRLKKVRNFVKI